MAKTLAAKLGSILPRIFDVSLTDPSAYVENELFTEGKAIKKCIALNTSASVSSVVDKASESCCNAFQMCLLTANTLFYNPQRDELRFASPLSLEAFSLVAQNSSLALSSPL